MARIVPAEGPPPDELRASDYDRLRRLERTGSQPCREYGFVPDCC